MKDNKADLSLEAGLAVVVLSWHMECGFKTFVLSKCLKITCFILEVRLCGHLRQPSVPETKEKIDEHIEG